jgi:redox-sensitive bicupin YhaK (pirin superfamily)
MQRAIKTVIAMPWHGFDQHSGAYMLHPQDIHLLDPFIGVDSYIMPQPFFPPHPHAGMSAVTLMLEHSAGGFINRDSLGDKSAIRPGDLHWTQAGAGMMHEEIPAQPGVAAQGLQIFVNLAAKDKQAAPHAFHVAREDMPTYVHEGVRVRAVAGETSVLHAGESTALQSPIAQDARWLTRADLIDVQLVPHAQLELALAPGKRAFVVLREGALAFATQTVAAPAAVVFEDASTASSVILRASDIPVRAVLFSGTPLNEAVFPKGPFVGNTPSDIATYVNRFQRGEMGRLEKSF